MHKFRHHNHNLLHSPNDYIIQGHIDRVRRDKVLKDIFLVNCNRFYFYLDNKVFEVFHKDHLHLAKRDYMIYRSRLVKQGKIYM